MKKLAIGLDIGGTSSKFGFVNREGNIIKQSRMSTQDFKDSRSFISELKNRLEELHSLEDVVGVGNSAPTPALTPGRSRLQAMLIH